MRKIIIILISIPLVITVLLGSLYLYADNKPDIKTGYNKKIETGGLLEKKYLNGGNEEVTKTTYRMDKPINRLTVWYPKTMLSSHKQYPMIIVVNGTGGKETKYEPQFALYASWGFIVVGNQDKNTGTGATTITTLHKMLDENDNKNSLFYNKINRDAIGLTGFSQGGAAVFNVLTKYEEAKYIKAAAPLSPVSEKTAQQFTNYAYNSQKITTPIMILTGTKGDFETKTVIPFKELKQQYQKIPAPKVMARRTDMTHDDMLYSAGGYVIAWMRWQLMNDSEAKEVFVGDHPELIENKLYQDQKIHFS